MGLMTVCMTPRELLKLEIPVGYVLSSKESYYGLKYLLRTKKGFWWVGGNREFNKFTLERSWPDDTYSLWDESYTFTNVPFQNKDEILWD
jgi:hypothetical protein